MGKVRGRNGTSCTRYYFERHRWQRLVPSKPKSLHTGCSKQTKKLLKVIEQMIIFEYWFRQYKYPSCQQLKLKVITWSWCCCTNCDIFKHQMNVSSVSVKLNSKSCCRRNLGSAINLQIWALSNSSRKWSTQSILGQKRGSGVSSRSYNRGSSSPKIEYAVIKAEQG